MQKMRMIGHGQLLNYERKNSDIPHSAAVVAFNKTICRVVDGLHVRSLFTAKCLC